MASLAEKAVVGALCMDGTERIRPVCPFSLRPFRGIGPLRSIPSMTLPLVRTTLTI